MENHTAVTTDIETFERTTAYRDGYVGVFDLKATKKVSDFCVIALEDWELGLFTDMKVKAGEILARYETETSKIGGFKPLIKINQSRGMIYFLDDEGMAFQTRGEKVRFMKLSPEILG